MIKPTYTREHLKDDVRKLLRGALRTQEHLVRIAGPYDHETEYKIKYHIWEALKLLGDEEYLQVQSGQEYRKWYNDNFWDLPY